MRYSFVLFIVFSVAILSGCSQNGEAPSQEEEVDIEEVNVDKEAVKTDTKAKSNWETYHNQRFEFCVEYPTDFLTAMGESQNRDGNTFATANRSSEMRASGMPNAMEQTIEEYFQSVTENDRFYNDEQVITYKVQKGNWFVVSGKYNESIFYARTVLKDDIYYTLYFEYHSSEKKKFEEIIARTTKGFPKC